MNRMLKMVPWMALWVLTLALLFQSQALPSMAVRNSALIALQAGDSAHCAGDALVQTGPLDVDCVAFTPTPTATATSTATDTPTATATNTLAPTVTATFTPLPTDTPTSTATATATLAATNTPLPRSQWPLCPSHDDTQWHALDDASRQCHYDHEHGDDPNDPAIAAIFGPGGMWTAGQTISYPWATSAHENHMKHGGYKVYAGFRACNLTQAYNGISPVNCIKAFRIETHNIGQQIDVYARYHSYFAEFQICKYPAYTECGVMRVGGWMDFGILISPYISHRVVRPTMDIDFGLGSTYGAGGIEMLMHFDADTPELDQITLADNAAYSTLTPDTPHNRYVIATYPPALDGSGSQSSWSGPNLPPRYTFSHNPFLRYKVDILDAWNLLDASILTTPQFICRDGSCAFNGSIRGASELSARVISAFDPDADGFADYSGFSDRFGNVVQGCAGVALDCVPFSMAHAPTGYAAWNPGGCECGVGIDKEYDTSPTGHHWVQFPD